MIFFNIYLHLLHPYLLHPSPDLDEDSEEEREKNGRKKEEERGKLTWQPEVVSDSTTASPTTMKIGSLTRGNRVRQFPTLLACYF